MADHQPQLNSNLCPLPAEELERLEKVVGQKTGKEIWVMMLATGQEQWLRRLDGLMLLAGDRLDIDADLANPASLLSRFVQVSPTLLPHFARMLKWQRWALQNHRRCQSHARLN